MNLTIFYERDDKGKKQNTAAHAYCETCDTNYSSNNIERVEQFASSHPIQHIPFVYIPDVNFYKENN